jgi:hypothetical protein
MGKTIKFTLFLDFSFTVFFTLLSLGKLGLQFSSLPFLIKSILSNVLYTAIDKEIAPSCSYLFYSLVTIQASWDELEERVCQRLLNTVRKNKNNLTKKVRVVVQAHCFIISFLIFLLLKDLSNSLFSVALLSFDFDLSKNCKKTTALIEIHRLLLEIHFRLVNSGEEKDFSDEQQRQLAIYFETLSLLPEERRKTILGNKETTAIPLYSTTTQVPNPTPDHLRISKMIVASLRMEKAENPLELVNEFCGLTSRVFPVDIAVRDRKTGKLLLFVELDGGRFHYQQQSSSSSTSGGLQTLKRAHQLKTKLYEHYYPGVPLKRIRLSFQSNQTYATEILQTIRKAAFRVDDNPFNVLSGLAAMQLSWNELSDGECDHLLEKLKDCQGQLINPVKQTFSLINFI